MFSAFNLYDNSNDYRTTALKRAEGKDLSGRIVIVTGANGALGQEMCLALLTTGATVVATARSVEKMEAAKKQILTLAKEKQYAISKGRLECEAMDLGDYESIDKFVRTMTSKKYDGKVDALLNNAGAIAATKMKTSKYGLETTFQTNFVSTVVLTEKILPLLTENGRVIHQSTMSHKDCSNPVDFGVIPSKDEAMYGGYNKDYAESKWMLTAYSSHLARRGITSVCSDPGVSPDSAMWDEQVFLVRFLARHVFKALTKTSAQAAGCMVALTVNDQVESGGYYQSGVLGPPLREDTTKVEEWIKAADVLRKSLPDDLKSLVHED